MSLKVYRLVHARHAGEPFSGEGARRFGGRWNPKGVAVAYASTRISLAVLETLVHLGVSHLAQLDLRLCTAVISADVPIKRLTAADLPADWADVPGPPELRRIGRNWVESGESIALIVPSAVVLEEDNVLINPAHSDARRIAYEKSRPFRLDERLLWAPRR